MAANQSKDGNHFLDQFVTDDVVHVERHISTNNHKNGNAVTRAARGEVLAVMARISMLAIWPIVGGISYVSWTIGHDFFSHLITSIDTLGDKLERTTRDTSARIQDVVTATRDLKQSVDLGVTTRVDALDKAQTDHEDRIRKLEYVQHPTPTVPPAPRVSAPPTRRETGSSPTTVTASPNPVFPFWR